MGLEKYVKINGKMIYDNTFAYDNCHKIYILETLEDKLEAIKLGYKITLIDSGSQKVFYFNNKKEKDKWLYELFTCQERTWAFLQLENSPYKTFDKWFKNFVKPKWKGNDYQFFHFRNNDFYIFISHKICNW